MRSQPCLYQLGAISLIAEHGVLAGAAAALSRTPSALSKLLRDVEHLLGARLFDRLARGMVPTREGELLIARIREAEAHLDRAAAELAALDRRWRRGHGALLMRKTRRRHWIAFLLVHETRSVSIAAASAGVSRAAIYEALHSLSALLELPLFEAGPDGMRSTPCADVLVTPVALAHAIIAHGIDEMASLDGVPQGHVVIGTLPYSRTVLVPRAINRLLDEHPQIRIATREGTYDVLEHGLCSGTVDLIVGATRSLPPDAPLRTEDLLEDELAVICGVAHPLVGRGPLNIRELTCYGWILPARATPSRQLFDRFLARHGLGQPQQIIESGSLSTVRGLLLESDRLALLSRHQVLFDERAGLLTTLPIRLEATTRPIGITTLAKKRPSPAARLLIANLRSSAAFGPPIAQKGC